VQACWPDPAAVLPAREAARVAYEADMAAKAYAKANDY
jgi:23S rRNA (cytidine1920-2'-O)/16S rRNA (cytidine1409-2'-O)-methyltransferase